MGDLSKEERTQASDPLPPANGLGGPSTLLTRLPPSLQDHFLERLPVETFQAGSGAGHRAGGRLTGSEGPQNPALVVPQEGVDPKGNQFQAQ